MRAARNQRGAALIIALIMLVLITLTVTTAFTTSTSSLKAVGNLQTRNEAVASANRAIEEVVTSLLPPAPDGTPSLVVPVATASAVDLDNDGKTDYTVQVAAPACARASQVTGTSGTQTGPGGITGGASSDPVMAGVPDQYNGVWDIQATVTDSATGTAVVVRQGVRMLLNKTQYQAFCLPPPIAP